MRLHLRNLAISFEFYDKCLNLVVKKFQIQNHGTFGHFKMASEGRTKRVECMIFRPYLNMGGK